MYQQASRDLIHCPACHGTLINRIGPLPYTHGAMELSTPGTLYQCTSCSLLTRHPFFSEKDLEIIYSEFFSETWANTHNRYDIFMAANIIQNSFPSGNILDIGCFQGNFLNLLPITYIKYGIEPSNLAREKAKKQGINILSTSLVKVRIENPMFHAITLLDVFEHLPSPMDSLKKIVDLLLPEGIVIISTGNTDVLPWRLMRLDYWYYFPEHVNFFNPKWFHWAAERLNLSVIMIKKYSHFKGTLLNRYKQLVRCVLFSIVKYTKRNSFVYNRIISIFPFKMVNQWKSPPSTNLWRDHMIVVCKKSF